MKSCPLCKLISPETVIPVNVPTEVMFVCAAPVTVAAVPEALPVTLPVKAPVRLVDVSIPDDGLYVNVPVSSKRPLLSL